MTAIRSAVEDDADQIAEIYSHHVLHGTASYDMEPTSATAMRDKIVHGLKRGWPFLVAESDGAVVGYAYATQFRDRPAYAYACENSIYVHPEHYRHGIGRQLLSRLITAAEQAGFRQMVAVIGGGEPASVALHRSLGFVEAGRLSAVGWKHGRWLDSVYLQLALGPGAGSFPKMRAISMKNDAARPAMTLFERYLTVWVGVCIVLGIAFGVALPDLFGAIAEAEVAQVNLPVALLVWLMIIPMLLKIDFGALGQVRQHLRGVGVTLFINWAVKPFSMALLGTVFIGWLFRPLLPADQIDSYIAGLILLAAAPCTAMVFVWSNLCEGEPHYTLSQVALNDLIMVFAFAPLVGLLLGFASITVPWDTLLLSVILYIVVPVIVAQLIRRQRLASGGPAALDSLLRRLAPVSLVALLATLVLLFGFQGNAILAQPLVIALLAVPILIQVYFNAGLAYWLSRRLGVAWCVAAPAALIGASNFFELAVAAAISLFGLQSGAALATVVGVLVEVPVMLSVVSIVKRSRGWYDRRGVHQAVSR